MWTKSSKVPVERMLGAIRVKDGPVEEDKPCQEPGCDGYGNQSIFDSDGKMISMRLCRCKRDYFDRKNEEAFISSLPPLLRKYDSQGFNTATRERERKLKVVNMFVEDGHLEGKPGILMHGSPGTGKTRMLVSIGKALSKNGKVVRLMMYSSLISKLRKSYGRGEESFTVLDEISGGVEVLLLDDLGQGTKDFDFSRDEFRVLSDILNHIHINEKILVVTSNIAWDELQGHIGDSAKSRLAEMCCVVAFGDEDYRQLGKNLKRFRT